MGRNPRFHAVPKVFMNFPIRKRLKSFSHKEIKIGATVQQKISIFRATPCLMDEHSEYCCTLWHMHFPHTALHLQAHAPMKQRVTTFPHRDKL